MSINNIKGMGNIGNIKPIKSARGFDVYSKTASVTTGKTKPTMAVDEIKISGAALAQKEISDLTKSIADEIKANMFSPAGDIQSLSEQVANGTYDVSDEDIAAAILGKI
jgi:anti-sigma28 factor (negative regulator of flagellin synthesis)